MNKKLYHAIVIKPPPLCKPLHHQYVRGPEFLKPLQRKLRRRRNFLKPLQANLGILRILGLLTREARGKFWEFLPLKTAFLVNFWYVCSKIFETPLGQIGEFPRIFETPPTQIGLWAKIFETPPEELVAGGDLKGGV